jgi:hypothetical protein
MDAARGRKYVGLRGWYHGGWRGGGSSEEAREGMR